MAKDIQDEGSEEQKKQNTSSQDDDDFGLPDLEFEELDELDLDFEDKKKELDESINDEIESENITLTEDDLTIEQSDPEQDVSRVLEDEGKTENSAQDSDKSEDETNESLFSSDETSESLFSADETNDDILEGSGDFDGGSIFESDNVILKEQEKEEFESAVDNQLPPSYKPYSDGELKGGFTKIIIFGAIGFVLIGLVFLFVFKQGGDSPQPVNKAKATVKIETPKTDAKTSAEASKSLGEVTRKKEEKPVDPKSDAKTVKKATPAAKVSTPAGEIVNVQTKTGRSYIIIGSFIDQDLANDFAKELASAGKGVKIIFPYDNSKRYRVSIADFDSYSDAAVQISSFKSTYGDGAWVLKY